jgi:hypothetical protein
VASLPDSSPVPALVSTADATSAPGALPAVPSDMPSETPPPVANAPAAAPSLPQEATPQLQPPASIPLAVPSAAPPEATVGGTESVPVADSESRVVTEPDFGEVAGTKSDLGATVTVERKEPAGAPIEGLMASENTGAEKIAPGPQGDGPVSETAGDLRPGGGLVAVQNGGGENSAEVEKVAKAAGDEEADQGEAEAGLNGQSVRGADAEALSTGKGTAEGAVALKDNGRLEGETKGTSVDIKGGFSEIAGGVIPGPSQGGEGGGSDPGAASAMDVDVQMSAGDMSAKGEPIAGASSARGSAPTHGAGESDGVLGGSDGAGATDLVGKAGGEAASESGPPAEVEFPEDDLGLDEEMWEAGEETQGLGGLETQGLVGSAVGGTDEGGSEQRRVGGNGAVQNGLGEPANTLPKGAQNDGGLPNGEHRTEENGPGSSGKDAGTPSAMEVDGEEDVDLLSGPRLAPLGAGKQKGFATFAVPKDPEVRHKDSDARSGRKCSREDASPEEPAIDPALQPQSFSLARRRVANVIPPSRGVLPPQKRPVTLKDLIALLEKEPQMTKSAVLYKLYCQVQREQGRGLNVPRAV